MEISFFKFKKLALSEIEKIIDPFNLDLFEIYTPNGNNKYLEFAVGAVIDEHSIKYLKERFEMFKLEFTPATRQEFIQAKENVTIDYAYINNGKLNV